MMTMTSKQRAALGDAAISAGIAISDDYRIAAIDAITNILHAVNASGQPIAGILDIAQMHFEIES